MPYKSNKKKSPNLRNRLRGCLPGSGVVGTVTSIFPMKSFLISFLLLCASLSAFGQGSVYSAPVQAVGGQAIPGAAVAICTSRPALTMTPCQGSTLATIYTYLTLGTVSPNPLTTDSSGMFYVYDTPGTVLWAQIYGAGIFVYIKPFVVPGLSGGEGADAAGQELLLSFLSGREGRPRKFQHERSRDHPQHH